VLVDGTSVHPHKPLDGFTLEHVSGTCAKGVALANAKNVVIRDVKVSGFSGPLISTNNVTGSGLEAAATIPAPKVPDAVAAPTAPYVFK
jgi:hypothetical protein